MLIEKRAPPPETGVGGARLRRAYASLSHPDHPNLKLLGFRVLFEVFDHSNFSSFFELFEQCRLLCTFKSMVEIPPGPGSARARKGTVGFSAKI